MPVCVPLQLEGDISDQERTFFDSGTSLPALCQALRKAALDPRIQVGVCGGWRVDGRGWRREMEAEWEQIAGRRR